MPIHDFLYALLAAYAAAPAAPARRHSPDRSDRVTLCALFAWEHPA